MTCILPLLIVVLTGFLLYKAITYCEIPKADTVDNRARQETFEAMCRISNLWSTIQTQWRPATAKDLRKGVVLWYRGTPYNSWSVKVVRVKGSQFWHETPYGDAGPNDVNERAQYGLTKWYVWEGHPFAKR